PELGIADVTKAVPQLGGYGLEHCRRLNGHARRYLAMAHADVCDRRVSEETVDRGDDVGRDMLQHRSMCAADRQMQCPARLLPCRKAYHGGLRNLGQFRTDNFAPATDHR